MRNVVTLVLGGGRGSRLLPLTKYRSKPAVPLAGKYRLIDIPLSNCINSGLRRIYVLTQFMSVSLHRHIRQTYRFDAFSGGFVEILAAQQTMDGIDWYEGTADAVRKQIVYLEQSGIEYVMILSGDQLYRMNYRDLLRTHIDSQADATIAAIPVGRDEAAGLGVMHVDDSGTVRGFVEKPSTDEQIQPVLMDPKWIDAQGIESRGRECLASMGIYTFNLRVLIDVLESTSYQDFGKEVFPSLIGNGKVQVHLFDGYWEDIGTIKAYFEANLQLATDHPPFNLISAEAPLYSRARFLPPSRLDGAHVSGSLIADGCRISPGARIENSVIGLRCMIGENVVIRDSIIMGNDEYETELELREDGQCNRPPLGIGAESVILGSIVDKNCRIGRGVRVENKGAASAELVDHGPCAIRDGIPIALKGAVVPDGWQI